MTAPSSSARTDGNAFGQFLARRWISIVLVALVVVLIVQNRREASIDLLWWTVSAPLWAVLTVVLLAGVLAGGVRTRRRQRAR